MGTYSRRKKKKQSGGNNGAIIVLSLVIVGLLLFIFVNNLRKIDGDGNTKTPNTGNSNITDNYNDYSEIDLGEEIPSESDDMIVDNDWKIGDQLAITGNITSIGYDEQTGTTHKIIHNHEDIYLKSKNGDLSEYEGKVVISGFISDIIGNKNILIVESIENYIEEVVEEDNEEEKEISEETKRNIYSGQGININVSNWNNLELATNDNGTISIMSGSVLTGEAIIEVIPFKCSGADYSKDCNTFKKSFESFGYKYTTNNNNVKFWKMDEEQQRMAFGGVFGYKFKPVDNESFLSITNSISFEDTSALLNDVILETCNDISSQIKLTSIINTEIGEGNTQTIKGKDDKANDIICTISVDYENGILVGKLINIQYQVVDDGTIVEINQPEETPTLEEENVEEKPLETNDTNDTEENTAEVGGLNKDDYLTYNSSAYGYEVWMPKSSKFEAPAIIEQPFAVAGLECLQVVKIARWSGGDLASPDVKVYYCETNVSVDAIKEIIGNGYRIVETNDNIFIVEHADGYESTANGLVLF